MAATNRGLPARIAQGYFRQDLYDRLAVLEINLPPLRERGEDLALLARHFTGRRPGVKAAPGRRSLTPPPGAAWKRIAGPATSGS